MTEVIPLPTARQRMLEADLCPDVMHGLDSQLGQNTVLLKAEEQEKTVLRSSGKSVGNQSLILDLGCIVDTTTPAAVGARFAPIVARVIWGNGSGNFEALVDYRNGVQISLAASMIQVSAFFEDHDAADVFDRAHLSAAISWGSRAGRSYPTRTLLPITVGIGANVTFAVPPFAYACILNATSAAALAGAVTQLGGPVAATDLVIRSEDISVYFAAADHEGIRLSGYTRFMNFNNSGGDAVTLMPMFALNL